MPKQESSSVVVVREDDSVIVILTLDGKPGSKNSICGTLTPVQARKVARAICKAADNAEQWHAANSLLLS